MPLSVEDLYSRWKEDKDIADDIYELFGGDITGLGEEDWTDLYGVYIPAWDDSPLLAARRQKELDLETAYAGGHLKRLRTERVLARVRKILGLVLREN